MRRRRSIPARLLILIGIALQLAAVWALATVDPVLEYVMTAPDVQRVETGENGRTRMETGLKPLIESRKDVEEQLAEAVTALSVSGLKSGVGISGGGETVTATLRGVDLRWLETCPRQIAEGRWMDSGELKRGAKVAVLDEDLAFALFGSEGAEGKEIEIAGARYTVIGTARHRRGVGEVDHYGAYIPLAAAANAGVQLDVVAMHALSAVSSGLDQGFLEAVGSAWGAGEMHNLRKERMGALLASRLLVFAFGMALVFWLMRRLAGLLRRWRGQIAALRAGNYARRWLGPAVARVLGGVLFGALLLLTAYALLSFAVAPVYSFTEWVPESLVSLSALRAVFWDRAAYAARTVAMRMPDSARIAFWGSFDRTGAAVLLLGLALGRRKMKKAANSGNQRDDGAV